MSQKLVFKGTNFFMLFEGILIYNKHIQKSNNIQQTKYIYIYCFFGTSEVVTSDAFSNVALLRTIGDSIQNSKDWNGGRRKENQGKFFEQSDT